MNALLSVSISLLDSQAVLLATKGQENPDFCASGTCGSFPYNPVVGSGTFGNRPVGPEILSFREVQPNQENGLKQ